MAPRKATARKWTADEVMACIRQRYSKGRRGWEESVLFEQVANGTGAGASRWIDAAVFDLWPSSGLTRRAIEIKVSRSDFLRELEKPAKHAWARTHFHEFWFAAPAAVVKEEELPEGVGWMKPRGKTMAVVRAARRQDEPQMDDLLLASLARCFSRAADDAARMSETRVLAESNKHNNALAVCRVVHEFLQSRNRVGCMIGRHTISADTVMATLRDDLEKATSNAKLEADREHVMDCLDEFRERIRALFQIFAQVAYVGLTEADMAGKSVVKTWGGLDEGSWQELVRRAKAKSKSGGGTADLLSALTEMTGRPGPVASRKQVGC